MNKTSRFEAAMDLPILHDLRTQISFTIDAQFGLVQACDSHPFEQKVCNIKSYLVKNGMG